ncbi:MAG TPA: alpha-glucosidase [Acidobacteriaceae bacterium]|nr:alpha-glucosidase [Acidobacteriaceae bacterium]
MTEPWWKHALIYEIYPRSFADSNGDGVGDLNGITEHLDYLEWLGVDALWLAPMFPSPQVDFGYDISDYEAIDPMYGTLEDFDRLQAKARELQIRVVVDMVLNHTSDKHKWFLESASSRDNAKADWYVWDPGVPMDSRGVTEYQKKFGHEGMAPPNNWVSAFGGSAWEWVPARRQFYYHFFYRQQPDLNWRNPAVEAAMFNMMRFWLDRGVAGFRLDAIPMLFEDPHLRNEEETGGVNEQGDPNLHRRYTYNLPQVHDVLRKLRSLADSYPGDPVVIGEVYSYDTAAVYTWYGGEAQDELHLPMDTLVGFGHSFLGQFPRFRAAHFRKYIQEAATQLRGSRPLFVFDNHDNPRSIDRFGDGLHDTQIAKLIATILLTTPATAMTYYGAEIGMVTTTPTRKQDVKDPIGITGWPKEKGRDGARTPMQWTPGAQAGFSTNPHTWLPVAANYTKVNVETESADPDSLLNWNKRLVGLRRTEPALHNGEIVLLDGENADVLSYLRRTQDGRAAVIVSMNMSGQSQTLALDLPNTETRSNSPRVLAATDKCLQAITSLNLIVLPPFSALIVSLW